MSTEEKLTDETKGAVGTEDSAGVSQPDEPADDMQSAAVPDTPPGQLPGDILAARRIELRLSIEEVASRLKLAPRQVVSLEANDFGALPGMATVRGFIRSYAKLLELNSQPLLAMLSGEPNPAFDPMVLRRPLPSPGFNGRRYAPPTRHRSGSRRMSALAVLMLAFIGAVAFAVYRSGVPQLPALDLQANLSAARGALGIDSEPAEVSPPAVEAAEAPAATASAVDSANALELKLREDAWVEVIAVDGERKLVSKLMKAGSVELVEVAEPVVLVVGNAAGVDASLRGQVLNLKAVARDNVAKLSLK